MGFDIYQVDAFTDRPFKGNPAAVCLLPGPREDIWMQELAKEMNLSETAFLHRADNGFNLRWFTPAVEVELCGHATLASAHILWETGWADRDEQALFHTLSGLLTATRSGEEIELNFPVRNDGPVDAPPGLIEALSVTPKYIGRTKHDYLLELDSEETVRNVRPDFAMLKEQEIRGVMVTSLADMEGYDFVSRFFAPGAGIDEDPVTGAAHCCLGPYWRNRLGKDAFVAYQASARGGTVRVRVEGERVILGGQAVTILRGKLSDVSIQ
jgi:PhzF family phenazine biosynthesis protein